MTKTPLRAVSLFAGIGGIDLGLHRLGARTVAYSEVEPYACSILAARFPDATNLGDITTIDWTDVQRDHGRIDIVAGGFPCQDLSVAGKRRGIHAGRSGLFFRMADAVRILRPRIVLMENVAGLLTGPGWMAAVVGELAEIGYDVTWDCIPAAAVGAPHRRDRIYLIATPEGTRTTPPVWHRPPYLAMRQAAVDTPRSCSGLRSSGANRTELLQAPEQWPTPTVADSRGSRKRNADGEVFGTATNPGTTLTDAAHAAERQMWPTPDASVANDGEGLETFEARRHHHRGKGETATRAGTPLTIAAQRAEAGLPPMPDGEQIDAERAMWPTPTTQDASNTAGPSQFDRNSKALNVVAAESAGARADGPKVAPLNPGFVEWLMGYPHGWTVATDPRAWWEWPAAELLNPDPWVFGEWIDVPRVLDGVPDRVARLRCLGNAVVPQVVGHVAEVIARNYPASIVAGLTDEVNR